MRPAGCSCLNKNREIRKESWFGGKSSDIEDSVARSGFKSTQIVFTHVSLIFFRFLLNIFLIEV